MLNLPPEIMPTLGAFAPVFSERVWDWVQVLVIGAILAPGKRTVSAVLTMVLAETTGTQPTIRYLHGLDLVAQSDGVSTEYFAYDGLGSVRQILNSAGSPLLTQTFDPYGNPYASTGVNESNWGYTGEYQDSNGLVFLRARYYNPAQGRFFQLDSWKGTSNQPQTLNPFVYTGNNPINYVDPSGQCPAIPIIIILLLALGLSGCIGPSPTADEVQASVMIEVCDDDICFSSLGTLVQQGVITHTHYVGEGPEGIYYADNPQESFERLTTSERVIIYGNKDEIELSGDLLNELTLLEIWEGSMLLGLPASIAPTDIGNPIALGSSIPPAEAVVFYAYIRGEDNTCVGWHCIEIGEAIFTGEEHSFGETSHVPTYIISGFSGETPSFGDSGGGLFWNNQLIGTHQGVQFDKEWYLWALCLSD